MSSRGLFIFIDLGVIPRQFFFWAVVGGGGEKLPHIPGNLQGSVRAQERAEKALSSHLWLTLRPSAHRSED